MYWYVINKRGVQSADDPEFFQVNLYESLVIAFLWKEKSILSLKRKEKK